LNSDSNRLADEVHIPPSPAMIADVRRDAGRGAKLLTVFKDKVIFMRVHQVEMSEG